MRRSDANEPGCSLRITNSKNREFPFHGLASSPLKKVEDPEGIGWEFFLLCPGKAANSHSTFHTFAFPPVPPNFFPPLEFQCTPVL